MELKIALSGPSGLGKTTLCKFIESEFDVVHLSTSAGDILNYYDKKVLGDRFGYSGKGHQNVINLSSQYPEFGKLFQVMVLNRRGSQINNNSGFVIDRTPIDNVSYMLTQNAHNMGEEDVKLFIQRAQEYYQGLTHVIQIRYSSDIPGIEDNNSRIPNVYYQRFISDVFMGVFSRYFSNLTGPKVITIDFWSLIQRKELVKEFIQSTV